MAKQEKEEDRGRVITQPRPPIVLPDIRVKRPLPPVPAPRPQPLGPPREPVTRLPAPVTRKTPVPIWERKVVSRKDVNAALTVAMIVLATGGLTTTLASLHWLHSRSREAALEELAELAPALTEEANSQTAALGAEQSAVTSARPAVEVVYPATLPREPVEVFPPHLTTPETKISFLQARQPIRVNISLTRVYPKVETRIPQLLDATFAGDQQAVQAEVDWMRKASARNQELAQEIYAGALAATEWAPASLVANLAQTILTLNPQMQAEVNLLLETALAAEAQRLTLAKTHPQVQNIFGEEVQVLAVPQPVVSEESILFTPPEQVIDVFEEASQDEESGNAGPSGLPFLAIGWMGRDFVDDALNRARMALGLADLGEATYEVVEAGTAANILPQRLRGGRLEETASRFPFVKLVQTRGVFTGKSLFLANFANFEVGDCFSVETLGEIVFDWISRK